MIPITLYILFSTVCVWFLRFTYRGLVTEALNSGENRYKTQAVRINVMINIASLIFLIAIVAGCGISYLMWEVEAFQELVEVEPMGLLFLLLCFSTVFACRIKSH